MKILFICPYPFNSAPSQRFRFEQYFPLLTEHQIQFKQSSFIDLKTWRILYKPGYFLSKIWGIAKGYTRRLLDILTLYQYDFIFIHRECAPFGAPIFEWLITQVFRKKVVFDFDDAIWIPNSSAENSKFVFKLKRYTNANDTCRWAYKISAGNAYLAQHARQFNPSVIVNPTTIDTGKYASVQPRNKELFTIGWTGSHSTVQYLNPLINVFKKLSAEIPFRLLVISDKAPDFDLPELEYRVWNADTETDDLLEITIGLMPVPDDKWAEGKCGFKALQYLALGIPSLVSPIGVNTHIITHGVNGFHCSSEQEWYQYIVTCYHDTDLLKKLSQAAPTIVNQQYAVAANGPNFLSLFQ